MPLSVTVFNEETFQASSQLVSFETRITALQNHLQKQMLKCHLLCLMKRTRKAWPGGLAARFPQTRASRTRR